MSDEYSIRLAETMVHINKYIVPNENHTWITIDIFHVPRTDFDNVAVEEIEFSDFWAKKIDMGNSNNITLYCDEPPVGIPNE